MFMSPADRRALDNSDMLGSARNTDAPYAHDARRLIDWLLDRREKALNAGLYGRAEQLLCLAWEAFDRAQGEMQDHPFIRQTEPPEACSATIRMVTVLPHPGMLPSGRGVASSGCSRDTIRMSTAVGSDWAA